MTKIAINKNHNTQGHYKCGTAIDAMTNSSHVQAQMEYSITHIGTYNAMNKYILAFALFCEVSTKPKVQITTLVMTDQGSYNNVGDLHVDVEHFNKIMFAVRCGHIRYEEPLISNVEIFSLRNADELINKVGEKIVPLITDFYGDM